MLSLASMFFSRFVGDLSGFPLARERHTVCISLSIVRPEGKRGSERGEIMVKRGLLFIMCQDNWMFKVAVYSLNSDAMGNKGSADASPDR